MKIKAHFSNAIAGVLAIFFACVITFCFYGFPLVFLYRQYYLANTCFLIGGFAILFFLAISESYFDPPVSKFFFGILFCVTWILCGLIVVVLLPVSIYTQSSANIPIFSSILNVAWQVIPLVAIWVAQKCIKTMNQQT